LRFRGGANLARALDIFTRLNEVNAHFSTHDRFPEFGGAVALLGAQQRLLIIGFALIDARRTTVLCGPLFQSIAYILR